MKLLNVYLKLSKKKINAYVWATPGLPMLIFVTLGLIVALLFGDFVWLLIRLFASLKIISQMRFLLRLE